MNNAVISLIFLVGITGVMLFGLNNTSQKVILKVHSINGIYTTVGQMYECNTMKCKEKANKNLEAMMIKI